MICRKLLLFSVFMSLITSGCISLLPSGRQTVRSPWESFEEAKKAYDNITINKTTSEDLKNMGFDPYSTPNIKILTYVDIIQKFMFNPSIKKEDLDEGLQECIRARTNCRAYAVEPRIISNKRRGNFFLDFLNFKRNTKETGWRFEALIVMVDDIVVYKQWGGNPSIDETRETKNPLGPLQNSADFFMNRVKP